MRNNTCVATFQILTVPSWLALANNSPLGEKASAVTRAEWPLWKTGVSVIADRALNVSVSIARQDIVAAPKNLETALLLLMIRTPLRWLLIHECNCVDEWLGQ